MSSPRSLPLVALALAVAVIVGHARVLLGEQTWDDVRYHTEVAPPRMAAAEAIQRGELPAWWDGTGLGVPLAAEPSHGALYPPTWVAASPRALDWLSLVHLAWAALGVAVWARGRAGARDAASDQGALVAGVLVASTGLLASAALRGALPALAHLPWIAVAARALAEADAAHARVRATIALAGLLALIALTGVLGALVDAVILALAIAAPALRRAGGARMLAVAIVAGLAIGCIQWIPAVLQLGEGAGASVHAMPLARLIELIVPGSFGHADPDRAITALAGEVAWAPSLFVGAPLLALAAVRTPGRRILAAIAVLAGLVLVAGRGPWPAWLGAPELHLGALVLVLAAQAGVGVDRLLAGDRRAVRAFAVAVGCMLIALAALAVLRGRLPEVREAIARALVDGGLAITCMLGVLVPTWWAARAARRERTGETAAPRDAHALRRATSLALIVLPGIGAMPSVAPTIERVIVTEPPPFVVALDDAPRPVRVFRPAVMPDVASTVGDAIATLAGSSAWRWNVIGARSEDPARPVAHDRTWLAAANEGGALLDRFGIGIAILPETMVTKERGFHALARRGSWALSALPVAPLASVMRSWRWTVATEDALAMMFGQGGGTNVQRGTVVLRGTGPVSSPGAREPEPCTIERWTAGDVAVRCHASADGYAVVSSTPSPGWTVTVDGAPAPWVAADVLRRAVAVTAGEHRVRWRYTTPWLPLGLLVAAAGVLALASTVILARRREVSDDPGAN